ncbi:MAG: S41 family peptidase [Crocinitomicaceae bacterium]
MTKSLLLFLALYFVGCSHSQTLSEYNLDFESAQKGILDDWHSPENSGYLHQADSTVKKSGKYSALIASQTGESNFSAISFELPHNYKGKQITLSGYLKTENVANGFAGLWMRIDPQVGFDNMRDKGIQGTTDWTKYEITLDLDPEKTDRIIIGALLAGTGKAWFDDFSVTIDGKDMLKAKVFERKQFPAELDHEFDEGSGISEINASKEQIKHLEALGYVWGFLKYYHPNVGNGDYNWDYELFRILPKMLEAQSNEQRDQVLVDWINTFGEVSKGKKPKVKSSNVKMTPDLDWIERSNFSQELVAKLCEIETAKRSGENYYVGLFPGVENPEFKNENPYANMNELDAGYRLLSLYRYWNIIHYYFPYKYLIEEDWKGVLGEFIPKFLDAKEPKDYPLACLEIITRVNDTHANIWSRQPELNKYWGEFYAPYKITFVEEKAVVTGYYEEIIGKASGLEIGDVIETVNGQSVDKLIQDRLHLVPASNYPTKLRNISGNLLNTNDSIIRVEYRRNDQLSEASFPSYSIRELNLFSRYEIPDSSFNMINDDVAYINHGELKIAHLPKIWEKIENTKGLIIDIRNYPSDFPIYDLSEYLMPKKTPYATFTKGTIRTPGYFTFIKTTLSVGKRKNKDYYKGKVIILVNEESQSSAEFHAMAYRVHPNATVIGSTTAGADGNVSRFNLPGGINTLITGIGVYYPDRGETQRIGIVPDIECKPTIQGIREGRDELIEKALEVIDKSH